MQVVEFILKHFALVMLLLAMLLILINLLIEKNLNFAEIAFRWLTLLSLGFTSAYSFVMHAFFPEFTAAQIGWQDSPFQFEVAMANLAFAATGILAFKGSFGFRLATVIGSTCWLWGDAIGHVLQMVANHNYAPANAGSWLWMDILTPLLLILCLFFTDHSRSSRRKKRT
jgi:hypothetical protein